jgi:hypothetical protein
MAEEQVNPFEQQPAQPPKQFAWGGMPTITPQEGQQANEGGSYFALSPEAMQMMWAPQQQTSLVPQQQPQVPPPQPQINPLV